MMKTRTSHHAAIALGAASILLSVVSSSPQAPADILTYVGPDRNERILEGARKEGQVVLYSAMIVNQALRPIADAFMKKYPFVKMRFWRADSENIAAKVSAEIRANNVVADLVEGTGIGEYIVQADQAQPFHASSLERIPERYRDAQRLWVPTRLSYYSVAYNTKLVPVADAPRTFEDLLDPRWKGKLSWRIGSISGTPLFITNLRMAWGEERAKRYLERLAEQKIVNFGSGSARTLVDRVIAGEYPIALNIFAHHPLISAAKGAPVQSVLMDPVATTAATMSVPKLIRNPHAALLLADFILSTEGQEILAQAEYFPVRPDVPPLPQLDRVVPAKAGVPENFINGEALNKYLASSEQMFQDLFR
jgi:ABC-type Fe3+ transport system substrate-binding protein